MDEFADVEQEFVSPAASIAKNIIPEDLQRELSAWDLHDLIVGTAVLIAAEATRVRRKRELLEGEAGDKPPEI